VQLARVVGQVVSTIKEPGLDGFKILVVSDIDASDPDGREAGSSYLAIDLVGAGEDEIVLVAQGGAARVAEASRHTPTDRAVVAIVDDVVVGGRVTFKK
jgi:ethanolamine utilization protein EutN